MNMHAAQLGAAAQHGKHLPWIQQQIGVKGAFESLLVRQVRFAEHLGHQVALLDADAVLAGQHAADLDAQPQDVAAEGLGTLELTRLIGIVKNQWVQIAIARVKDIRYTQTIMSRELRNAP